VFGECCSVATSVHSECVCKHAAQAQARSAQRVAHAGTIDIESALRDGVKSFEPGLLAKANRGILYVDEVNLLEDNLVDVVLDSAAGGVNTVEREGVSVSHPAKFIMIGSGNPSEGEMRPQLLDRFGLSINVGTLVDTDTRLKMVLDRLKYDSSPEELLSDAQVRCTASMHCNACADTARMRYHACGTAASAVVPPGRERGVGL
jgi:Mg-chelatase subunit ChlI